MPRLTTDYFIDTTFIEDGKTIDLVSLGMADREGHTLYLENAEADHSRANLFVAARVLPLLGPVEKRVSRAAMRAAVLDFIGDTLPRRFIADFGAYDWVAFCQLFGEMTDLPHGWPMYVTDFQQTLEARGVRRADLHDGSVEFTWRSSTFYSRCKNHVPHDALSDALHLLAQWRAVEFFTKLASLGYLLFEFETFQDWVDYATSRYAEAQTHFQVPLHDTVAVDGMGRICRIGRDFMRARDESTFPVTVHHIDPAWNPTTGAPRAEAT